MSYKEFFYFYRSDRILVAAVVVAAVVVVALMRCTADGMGDTNRLSADSTSARGAGAPQRASQSVRSVGAVEMPREAELFVFDPNTADSTALLRLGMQPWQVRAIYKYRAHGGVYRQPSDFARTYGLTTRQYRQLEPYIRISADFLPAAQTVASSAAALPPDTARHSHKLRSGEHVALNAADTAALQRVPGIGSYFARQIVRRRAQLGGFSSVSQLMEIDGFPEHALVFFRADTAGIRKLNVNRLSLSQLRRHPYVNFYQARAIVDYRRLHGEIKSIAELHKLKEFSDHDLQRLAPYLDFQ